MNHRQQAFCDLISARACEETIGSCHRILRSGAALAEISAAGSGSHVPRLAVANLSPFKFVPDLQVIRFYAGRGMRPLFHHGYVKIGT